MHCAGGSIVVTADKTAARLCAAQMRSYPGRSGPYLPMAASDHQTHCFSCSEEFDEIHTDAGGKKQLQAYCIGTVREDGKG